MFNPETIDQALKLLTLSEPLSREQLTQQYETARRMWHPARYAGLTNNPGKYMEMYKKGEAKTKEIQEAYTLLLDYLDSQEGPPSPTSPSP